MSALKAPSPAGPVPPSSAAHVGASMRVRAIGGATQRAFDPLQMTRDELVRFTLATMDENAALRDFAAQERAEFEDRLKRASDKALQAKRETDRWKTNYAFTMTLVSDTISRLITSYSAKRISRTTLEILADHIAETCTEFNPKKGEDPGGGLSYWLHKAKKLWDAVDGHDGILTPEEEEYA